MARSLKEFEQENQEAPVNTEIPTPSDAGQPSVKESMVIIDGKERPLKNYEAELRRKSEEEKEQMRLSYEQRLLDLQQRNTQPQQNWYDVIQQEAEQEIALTGKAVPLQTILKVSQSLYQRNIAETLKTKDNAEKEVRSFKRSIRKDPDFNEIEDAFDELVEQLKPEQINAPTLEVIHRSVRGSRLDEIVKKAKAEGRQEALKDSQIVGGTPVESSSGGTPPKTSLTSEQKTDMDRMNHENTMEWTEQEYKDALLKKQNRFKASGAKNIPQTLNDIMIK